MVDAMKSCMGKSPLKIQDRPMDLKVTQKEKFNALVRFYIPINPKTATWQVLVYYQRKTFTIIWKGY